LSTTRGEARRTAIVDAALRLVARGGPRAVTHRAVAAEADVPLAATTYYFATTSSPRRCCSASSAT
jgi:DNA-binding transcriptional regulator YbjK